MSLKSILGISGQPVQAITAVGGVLDNLFTSDEERLDKKALLQKLAMQPQLAQLEINKVEASHRSILVAGWRPGVGWTCAIGFALHIILFPIATYIMLLIDPTLPPPPTIDIKTLMTVLMALLGMGSLRTYEKLKGKTK